MAGINTIRSVDREAARIGIEAAVAESVRLGCRTCIAVLDATGELVSYDRMDGAPFQSAQNARDKALSSAGNGLSTNDMWAYVEHVPQLNPGALKIQGLSVIGGGIPIRYRDELIGAIGVSGSCGMPQDHAVAEAALDAILAAIDGTP